jgi:urease accessory protein
MSMPILRVARLCAAASVLAALQWNAPALAHSENALTGGFLAGFSHPLNGLDHLLAMVAVGLWGAFLGRPLNYLLPVIFPTVMAIGGIVGMTGLVAPPVELGIALSVLLLGALVAAARKLPPFAASAIVAVFALFHGFAHGEELPLATDPMAYSAGFVICTGLLHVAGIALGYLSHLSGPARHVPRALGVLITLAGIVFLARLFGG